MTAIPYKGNAPGLQDVVAGHVSVMFSDLPVRAAAGAERQAARARAVDRATQRRGSRHSDARRGRRPRLRRLRLADDGGAREDAEGDRRQAQCRAQGDRERSARPKAEIDGRGHIAIVTPPPDAASALSSNRRSCAGPRWSSRPVRRDRSDLPLLTAARLMRYLPDAEVSVMRISAGVWAICAALASQRQVLPRTIRRAPVTIIVPFAAGGGTDILARMVAQKLEQTARQDIRDREQAGRRQHHRRGCGRARPTPDGYTLLMAPSPTMAVSVTLYKKLAIRSRRPISCRSRWSRRRRSC